MRLPIHLDYNTRWFFVFAAMAALMVTYVATLFA